MKQRKASIDSRNSLLRGDIMIRQKLEMHLGNTIRRYCWIIFLFGFLYQRGQCQPTMTSVCQGNQEDCPQVISIYNKLRDTIDSFTSDIDWLKNKNIQLEHQLAITVGQLKDLKKTLEATKNVTPKYSSFCKHIEIRNCSNHQKNLEGSYKVNGEWCVTSNGGMRPVYKHQNKNEYLFFYGGGGSLSDYWLIGNRPCVGEGGLGGRDNVISPEKENIWEEYTPSGWRRTGAKATCRND